MNSFACWNSTTYLNMIFKTCFSQRRGQRFSEGPEVRSVTHSFRILVSKRPVGIGLLSRHVTIQHCQPTTCCDSSSCCFQDRRWQHRHPPALYRRTDHCIRRIAWTKYFALVRVASCEKAPVTPTRARNLHNHIRPHHVDSVHNEQQRKLRTKTQGRRTKW